MTEHSFESLETITDVDRYKLVYELGVTFDSLDTSKHDKKIYNQALEDFVENISLPMTEEQIGEIVEKLKR